MGRPSRSSARPTDRRFELRGFCGLRGFRGCSSLLPYPSLSCLISLGGNSNSAWARTMRPEWWGCSPRTAEDKKQNTKAVDPQDPRNPCSSKPECVGQLEARRPVSFHAAYGTPICLAAGSSISRSKLRFRLVGSSAPSSRFGAHGSALTIIGCRRASPARPSLPASAARARDPRHATSRGTPGRSPRPSPARRTPRTTARARAARAQ